MTALVFQPHRYPRTMSREEWYRTWRWVRQTRKELQSNDQKLLAAALVCGNDRIKADIMEHIIRPPIIVVSADLDEHIFDLRPGAMYYVGAPKKGYLP